MEVHFVDAEAGGKKSPKIAQKNREYDEWPMDFRNTPSKANKYLYLDGLIRQFLKPGGLFLRDFGFLLGFQLLNFRGHRRFPKPPRCKRIWFFIQGKNPMGQSAPLWFPDVAGLNITCGGKIEVFRPKSYVYQVMKRKAGKNTIGQPGVRMLLNFGGF